MPLSFGLPLRPFCTLVDVTHLQSLTDVACSAGVVDRGLWWRIPKHFLACTWLYLVWFGRYYKSTAETAGKYFLDGAVVPFETLWMLLGV